MSSVAALIWREIEPESFDLHAVATLVAIAMTLIIQRGQNRDTAALQAKLDQAKLRTDLFNSALFLKNHALSTKKLGVTGFCYGGGIVNYLAATLGTDMQAGVPYYGVAADTASVAKIKAPLYFWHDVMH